jgi:pyridinium-3,5-biscarboxylic acid mononucleotide synthase
VDEALTPAPAPPDPFAGLDAVLASAPVQVDPHRQARKGVPEVVYAAGKPPALTVAAVVALLARQPSGRVLVSRASAEVADRLRAELPPRTSLQVAPSGPTLLVCRADAEPLARTGGVVGLLTAGASDAPIADEAAWVAAEMGCEVVRADDVGVAGLHRLAEPLRRLAGAAADVVIVAAGMDGALPSVVAGLVDVPVIGLPTSIGYGLGGAGVAALLSMLQTCAPGLTVVNIDNGVGAGASAALIANRAAIRDPGRHHAE